MSLEGPLPKTAADRARRVSQAIAEAGRAAESHRAGKVATVAVTSPETSDETLARLLACRNTPIAPLSPSAREAFRIHDFQEREVDRAEF